MSMLSDMVSFFSHDYQSDRVVPPTGFTARLTVFASAAMAFLAVFALALSLATGRLAVRWGDELARSVTVRVSAPLEQLTVQTEAAVRVLETTTGVASARVLTDAEQRALLSPWFGADVPVDDLPIPRLIEVIETDEGFDPTGLRLRLQAEAPGAVLDDHTRWRKPLTTAASRLRLLGWASIILIGGTMAALITLAANAALSANIQVIKVLRLVGATDRYIARAFVRRFTLRALTGACVGTAIAVVGVALLPNAGDDKIFLTGLGFQSSQWALPLLIPLLAGFVAFGSTRSAANRLLRTLP